MVVESVLSRYAEVNLNISKIVFVLHKACTNDLILNQETGRSHHGIGYVLNGRASYSVCRLASKTVFTVQKHDVFRLHAGSIYQRVADADQPYEFVILSYASDDDEGICTLPLDPVISVRNPAYYTQLFLDLVQIFQTKRSGYQLRGKAILYEIFAQLVGDTASQHLDSQAVEKLNPALEYMETNYAASVTIQVLANQCDLSSSRFTHLFKEVYGLSPFQYLTSIRVSVAKNMLCAKAYTISAIADSVGYSDAYALSRMFKRETGLSPSEFTRQCSLR